MAGTSEGLRKSWLKRRRKGRKVSQGTLYRRNGREEMNTTLKSGMSFFDVAKLFGNTVKEIIVANNITSIDQIVAGMSLKLPAIKPEAQRKTDRLQKTIDSSNKSRNRKSKTITAKSSKDKKV